jgi:hypothetical protein
VVCSSDAVSALQGIWPRDFAALESWRKSDKRSLVVRDMAGNAFHEYNLHGSAFGSHGRTQPVFKSQF